MSVSLDPTADVAAPLEKASWIEEAQCGKLGFSIVTVNTVASAIFLGNLAIYGTLLGGISLGCAAVILPSIALFGVRNYFSYLPKPLEMGLGFAAAWATVKVDEKTGIWEGKFADWAHFYDGRLSQGLQGFFQNEHAHSIMDLGCGTGAYVNDLRKANLQCDGCDGNPDTPKLGGEHCKVVDLAQRDLDLRTNRGEKYDWAFSLEVGEHLPKEHEQAFLDNVVNTATKGIVLSWAKKGQGGLGHVNEQNNDYVEAQMHQRGWVRDKEAEEKLRLQTSPHCFWFRDTVMVYRPNPQ
ncbi:MAG: Methyltransferase type 11 [uncultured bacterium]|nr:MAG: Methyltransferase type 11 [uncultured bacterium]OGN55178.1 MAG: hypothetical protein A2796_05365 [Chlamydiae bacterium RIFCSPHIGHO2_01_FULL_44_39]OGN59583.1 MAG: hypothetical protein A3D96_06540 [Chlamydiae bacterium RIFCSPHIGHO2_12_FULL_44_59]OGN68439.1 MAG: hypothetical protein A3I67_06650 [Chlamydiae bacterium RIFCSPLOWO2_02_FULL_45_22]